MFIRLGNADPHNPALSVAIVEQLVENGWRKLGQTVFVLEKFAFSDTRDAVLEEVRVLVPEEERKNVIVQTVSYLIL